MENEQINPQPLPQTQPTAPITGKPSAPLSLKIFATVLLLMGLVIGANVLGMLPIALLSRTPPFLIMLIVGVFLFVFTEKTAIGLYKMNGSCVRNFYITIVLDSLYMFFKTNILLGFYDQNSLLSNLLGAGIIIAILGISFFLITRNKIPLPGTNPSRDNRIIVAIVIIVFLAGGIYSAVQNNKQKDAIDTVAQKTLEQPTGVPIETIKVPRIKTKENPDCQTLASPQLIQNTCGITKEVSLGVSLISQSSLEYCRWVTPGPRVEDLEKLGYGTDTIAKITQMPPGNPVLKLSSLLVSYDDEKQRDFGGNLPEGYTVEEGNDVGNRSFSVNSKVVRRLVFEVAPNSTSFALDSTKCSIENLKTIGRNMIANMETN